MATHSNAHGEYYVAHGVAVLGVTRVKDGSSRAPSPPPSPASGRGETVRAPDRAVRTRRPAIRHLTRRRLPAAA